MRRTTLLVTVALVLATVATVPIGGLAAVGDGVAAQQTTDEQPANETEAAPGERLSGVLNVGQAELETEVDSRTFGIKVAQAATQNAKADVVKAQLEDIEERIAELEERKAALERARENGSLSEGAYEARIAEVAAELEGAERLANQSAEAAGELPADLLESKGINVEAIQTLRDRADELGGQEVAEIARSIAGPSVGKAPGHAGPDDRGPGDGDDGDRTPTPDTPDGDRPTATPDNPVDDPY